MKPRPRGSNYNVIVVGAGLSGLTAASRILEEEPSAKVLVLEARDRVGGRIYSVIAPKIGTVVDMGASYVGPTQDRILNMACRFGVDNYKVFNRGGIMFHNTQTGKDVIGSIDIPPLSTYALLDFNSVLLKLEGMAATLDTNDPSKAANANELDNTSVKTWILQNAKSNEVKEMLPRVVDTIICKSSAAISMLFWLWYIKSGDTLKRLMDVSNGAQERKFKGGTVQIIKKLADLVLEQGGKLLLSSPVTKIDQTQEEYVQVTTRNGHVYSGSRIIVALPPNLHGNIEWQPDLAPSKDDVARGNKMGSFIKTVVFYKTAWWRQSKLNGQIWDVRGPILYSLEENAPGSAYPGITGFILTDDTEKWSHLDLDDRKDAIIKQYARNFQTRKALDIVDYVEQDWSRELEFTGGSAVSAPEIGSFLRTFDDCRRPFFRVHFAGTELATRWAGYMDGAIESGERAADEVIYSFFGRVSEPTKYSPMIPSKSAEPNSFQKNLALAFNKIHALGANSPVPHPAFPISATSHFDRERKWHDRSIAPTTTKRCSSKTAFVTGGTGFIGINLINLLIEQGWKVTALHRKTSDLKFLKRLPQVKLVEGALDDEETLRQSIAEGTDVVFHVAGDVSLYSRKDKQQNEVNINGTRNMINAAASRGVKTFVHTSSISAWGLVGSEWNGKITEVIPQKGSNSWVNYERSKYYAEIEALKGIQQGMKVVILNPGDTFGPYDTSSWGRLFFMIRDGCLPAMAPGELFPVHVQDVAEAYIRASENGRSGERYILAGDACCSTQVVAEVSKLLDASLPLKIPVWAFMLYGRISVWIAKVTGDEPDVTPEIAAITTISKASFSNKKAITELGCTFQRMEDAIRDNHSWLMEEGLLATRKAKNCPQVKQENTKGFNRVFYMLVFVLFAFLGLDLTMPYPTTGRLREDIAQPLPMAVLAIGTLLDSPPFTFWDIKNAQQLMAKGAEDAGLPPNYPDEVVTAIEVLCRSFEEDDVKYHFFGRVNIHDTIVSGLSHYLQVNEMHRLDPELSQTTLNSPLIVTGLPRTGTTHLHRLLSLAPDSSISIPMWEHFYPAPPRIGVDLRRWTMKIRFVVWTWIANRYGIDSIHFIRPDEADECNFSLRLGGASSLFWSTAPTYGYADWLLGGSECASASIKESYRVYLRVLQIIQARNPDKRLVLKCPYHALALETLVEVIPNANLIFTHRNPLKGAIASEISLLARLHATSASSFDFQRSIKKQIKKVYTMSEGLVQFANNADSTTNFTTTKRIFHSSFSRLLENPQDLIQDIHSSFDIPFTAKYEKALTQYIFKNARHSRGKHLYSLNGTEITELELAVGFQSYMTYFEEYIN